MRLRFHVRTMLVLVAISAGLLATNRVRRRWIEDREAIRAINPGIEELVLSARSGIHNAHVLMAADRREIDAALPELNPVAREEIEKIFAQISREVAEIDIADQTLQQVGEHPEQDLDLIARARAQVIKSDKNFRNILMRYDHVLPIRPPGRILILGSDHPLSPGRNMGGVYHLPDYLRDTLRKLAELEGWCRARQALMRSW